MGTVTSINKAVQPKPRGQVRGTYTRWEYFDIVKDINATILMSQIHFWYLPDQNGHNKLRVFKHDHYWIAKDHKGWWEEVRLTEKQVSRSIAILVKHGLIQVKNHLFSGKRTRHIRCEMLENIPLHEREFVDVLQAFGFSGKDPQGASRKALQGVPRNDLQGAPITETTTEMTAKKTRAKLDASQEDSSIKIRKNGRREKGVTSSAAVLMGIVKPTEIKDERPWDRFYKMWASQIPKHHARVKFIPPFTHKEVAQAKRLIKIWGDDWEEILLFTIRRWVGFGKYTVAQVGDKKYPAAPNLAYLIKYLGQAKSYWLEQNPPVQLIAKPRKIYINKKPEEPKQKPVEKPVVPDYLKEFVEEMGLTPEQVKIIDASDFFENPVAVLKSEQEKDKPLVYQILDYEAEKQK